MPRRCRGRQRGIQADLIAVEGNPLVDVAALRKVSLVMRAGKLSREPGPAAGR
jgi:imidazolonepropionase-like amidohydrolase